MPRRRAKPRVDRISSLPDEVICHILSFLPTKLAVAPSILSNRWYPLWRSLTTLHFIHENISVAETHSLFKDFVFSVLLMRDMTQPIKSFHLKLGCYSSINGASNVNKWVHFAIQHGLEHLHLDFCLSPYVTLPRSILTCKTLIFLKLNSVIVNALPCDVDFPSLKILHWGGVSFDEHRYLIKFLNGCPILEDLKVDYLSLYDENRDDREVKSLAKLVRADVPNKFIPLTLLRNAEFLRVKLECFYYHAVSVFPNLTDMVIIFKHYNWHHNWHWLVGVLRVCPQLQILVIENEFMRDKKKMNQNYIEDWEFPQLVPECFSSQLRTCILSNYAGSECDLQFARYVMKNSKSLSTMTISSNYSLNIEEKLKILKKLTLCPRSSATCKLLFQ